MNYNLFIYKVMLYLILGIAIGVCVILFKDNFLKMFEKKDNVSKVQLDELCNENNKFRKRNKELENQVEDLLSELNKLRRKAKDSEDESSDLQDELSVLKRELNKCRQQNSELQLKIEEYKTTCYAYETQIETFKKQTL